MSFLFDIDFMPTCVSVFKKENANFILIDANKRADKLYHAYNLMTVENEKEVSISYLPEMLEGQVAILSSGFLSATESIKVLNSLKNSALYREDQYSYILYPNKELARFNKKNNIPSACNGAVQKLYFNISKRCRDRRSQ